MNLRRELAQFKVLPEAPSGFLGISVMLRNTETCTVSFLFLFPPYPRPSHRLFPFPSLPPPVTTALGPSPGSTVAVLLEQTEEVRTLDAP